MNILLAFQHVVEFVNDEEMKIFLFHLGLWVVYL